ncbi:glycosyltransferase family 2 protein [Flavobacterium sp. LAR06]|uniref:glycosyltransferase family 2 protein n=1 Tax=Flavobacterium sp. LAR06 TaxID=3064897 RepID=UPI0035C11BAE
MISIIVIGKNEGWRLEKCLKSISGLIASSSIEFEVIYMDSNSSDNSIEVALVYPEIRIFKIVGSCNAAVARNVGANESKGDVLFFVDGDMEIQSDFFNYILNEKKQLISEYITGHIDDCFYDNAGTFIGKSPRTYINCIPTEIQELKQNGGIYLITKKKWVEVGGMRTKFKINEDLDLTIRLRKIKIKIVRIPHLICLHHTIDYRNEIRMWNMILAGYGLYPGVIFRVHLFDVYVVKRFVRADYSAIFLMLALLFYKSVTVLVLYILILLSRALVHTFTIKADIKKIRYFMERLLYQFLFDILIWIGFFFFFPKKITFMYKKIR